MMNNAKGNTKLWSPPRCAFSTFHCRRLLVPVPLPLPGRIVTAAVSRCGNEGAWGSNRGGGWVTKNARFWEQRRHGGLIVSELREVYVLGVHGPRVCELEPRGCQAACDTFLRRPPWYGSHPPGAIPCALPNWQWVVPTRHIGQIWCPSFL